MRPTLLLTLALLAADPTAAQSWSSTNALTPARAYVGAGSNGTLAFFAGGGHPFVGYDDVVNVYDSTIGAPDDPAAWSTATLSEARANVAVTSVGDVVLFAGGNHGAFSTPVSDVVDIYDTSTGTWGTATLSEPRTGDVAVSIGGFALFCGGNPNPLGNGGPPSARVDVYEATTGAWTQASLSAPRLQLQATTVGPYALFAGGYEFTFGAISDVVDIYDSRVGPPTDPAAWSVLHLPQAHTAVAATSAGGKAYFAGGFEPTSPTTTVTTTAVDVYDSTLGPPTDPAAWSIVHLSHPTNTLTATSQGDLALFAGHYEIDPFGNETYHTTVDVFDAATGAHTTESISSGRSPYAATAGEYALLAGGVDAGWVWTPSTIVDARHDSGELGTRYCTAAVANSTGVPGRLSVVGSRRAALNDVTLRATSLPVQSFGFFLTSRTQDSVAQPGGSQGILCLGGSVGRYVGAGQIVNSGSAGALSLALDLEQHPTPTGFVAVVAGDTWNFQAWHRDANPSATSNFTDAVSVTLH